MRTGGYYWAIMENREEFEGKVVVDVGAGTGILAIFAAMVGLAGAVRWGLRGCGGMVFGGFGGFQVMLGRFGWNFMALVEIRFRELRGVGVCVDP